VSETPPHKKFEQQVEHIHQLLEVEGSTVTWNDHIPDPDNPSQPRQIDVSIRRDGALTLIECRIHKDPQDVIWIEELMGRRTSLKADAVIAVSASGFTKTAREKAAAHGIHLRDLAALSREEIQNWGRTRTVTLNFCEFTQVRLTIRASEPPRLGPPQLTDFDGKPPSPLIWRLLYQSVMQRLDADGWTGVPATIEAPLEAKLLVNGSPPTLIGLRAEIRRVSQSVRLASVFEYADPVTATSHAQVGSYELGASEIIESCDNMATTIDLSTIAVPDNCCFETVTVDAGRIVNARPLLIGVEQAMSCRIPIEVRYEFPTR
jgi:Restriction endonuclease